MLRAIVPVFRIIMILAAILAACQDFFGQNPDRIRIFQRVFAQDLPRNPGKCTIIRISGLEGAEIMSGQNCSPNKTGTLLRAEDQVVDTWIGHASTARQRSLAASWPS